ncbi:hypothetical protein AB0I39_28010 [Kitasatospora purpeofusca]|uniref:hypothetical protein n=1 Tax=Kitasatospora purpeofusca TaxID=67352 RepID=UPI0033E645CF
MTDNHDFDALLEQSSLGSPGARQLRARTPATRADTVRRIIELRNTITRSSSTGTENENAVRELAELLDSIGGSSVAPAPEASDAPLPQAPLRPSGGTAPNVGTSDGGHEIAALARYGATVLVGLMPTELWRETRERLAAMFGQDQGRLREQLEAMRENVLAQEGILAEEGTKEVVANQVVDELARLLEHLVAADPQTADRLRTLVMEFAPPAGKQNQGSVTIVADSDRGYDMVAGRTFLDTGPSGRTHT